MPTKLLSPSAKVSSPLKKTQDSPKVRSKTTTKRDMIAANEKLDFTTLLSLSTRDSSQTSKAKKTSPKPPEEPLAQPIPSKPLSRKANSPSPTPLPEINSENKTSNTPREKNELLSSKTKKLKPTSPSPHPKELEENKPSLKKEKSKKTKNGESSTQWTQLADGDVPLILSPEIQNMLLHYFASLANVDFSQISEEKKASLGLSLLEKLLKGSHA